MIRSLTVAAALLAVFSVSALAQGNESYIEYRQKVMTSVGQNMGGIGDILKNKLPYGKNIAQHAQVIALNAKMMNDAFEKNVSEGKTDSKPEVWKNWAKFQEGIKMMETESSKLAQVAAGGDMAAIGEQVKKLGGACKNCHDDFRKPKEQSYKNK